PPILPISSLASAVLPCRIVADRSHTDEQIDVTHDFRKDQRRNLIHVQRFVDLVCARTECSRTVAATPGMCGVRRSPGPVEADVVGGHYSARKLSFRSSW